MFCLATLKAVSYGSIPFPGWAVGLGWAIGSIPVTVAILPSFFVIRRAKGDTLMQVNILSSVRTYQLSPNKILYAADDM